MTDKKIANPEQLCYVRESALRKGKAAGQTILDVYNGVFHFTVLPDKGMDIYSLSHCGDNLSFISKNGLTNGEGDFMSAFPGGFLYTCGLEAIGRQPDLPMHGSYHNTSADNYSYECDGKDITVRGAVRSSALFGRNVTIKRIIKTRYGSDEIELSDFIQNEGYTTEKIIYLYHFNLGYPFLDEGTYIKADIKSTQGVTPFAETRKKDMLVMTNPIDAEEQCFCHEPNVGDIQVVCPKLKKSIRFYYDTKNLPHLIEWKSMVAGDYALGIEPACSPLVGERQYVTLKAGGSVEIKFKINVKNN